MVGKNRPEVKKRPENSEFLQKKPTTFYFQDLFFFLQIKKVRKIQQNLTEMKIYFVLTLNKEHLSVYSNIILYLPELY